MEVSRIGQFIDKPNKRQQPMRTTTQTEKLECCFFSLKLKEEEKYRSYLSERTPMKARNGFEQEGCDYVSQEVEEISQHVRKFTPKSTGA